MIKIPPRLPTPAIRIPQNKLDQKVMRNVTLGGNVNALAGSLCALVVLKLTPFSSNIVLLWIQASLCLLFGYCAAIYFWRAYDFFIQDYTERCSFVDANDDSKTVQGADSKVSDLEDLTAAGMIGNANERIIGNSNGVPVNTPPRTTFVKYSAMQGASKTIGYVVPNALHMANTKAHFTADLDHKYTEIQTEDGSEWEEEFDAEELVAFDAAQSAPIDPFAIEGELFHERDRHE